MAKFKVGDKVKRIADSWHGMKIGDVATVRSIDDNTVSLEDYGGLHDAKNFKLAIKSFENLEVGDIIVDTNGTEAEVLAVLGDVFLRSCWNDFEMTNWWGTSKEAQNRKWKIKGAETDTVKMTVSEVSKLVGKKVEIIEE